MFDTEILRPGMSVDGPALIRSPFTTLVLGQGDHCEIMPLGDLVVRVPPDGPSATDVAGFEQVNEIAH